MSIAPSVAVAAGAARRPAASAANEWLVVGAFVLVGIAMRLPALLFDGLWRDDANVYVQLSAPDVHEFWRRVTVSEWHPPLFFALMYGWARVVGNGEIAFKLLPFCFSVATIGVVYRLVRTVGSRNAAAIGAALYAAAPMAVAYSTEYLYPVMAFFVTLQAWLVMRALGRTLSPATVVPVAVTTLCVVATHYTGLVYVALCAVGVLSWNAPPARRAGIAAALTAGAAPFALWLPVFLAQRRIGLPFSATATVTQKLLFSLRTLEQYIPVPATLPAVLFCAFIAVAVWALVRTRRLPPEAIALGLLFVTLLGFIAGANLLAARYVIGFYGLACAALGLLSGSALQLAAATDPAAWRRWGRSTAAVLSVLLLLADARHAVATSQIPKSGIRSLMHAPGLAARTLYVLAPDYLASTFAYYTRNRPVAYRGFVRWDRPEIFRLAHYAADWDRPDAVDRTLRAIAAQGRNDRVLDVIADAGAGNHGRMAYGKVNLLLRRLGERYRLLARTRYPGRYESVIEYRYALRAW